MLFWIFESKTLLISHDKWSVAPTKINKDVLPKPSKLDTCKIISIAFTNIAKNANISAPKMLHVSLPVLNNVLCLCLDVFEVC